MVNLLEITTIKGKSQRYSLVNTQSLRDLDEMISLGYKTYISTGLDEAIKDFPPCMKLTREGGRYTDAHIEPPETLRLVHIVGEEKCSDILRICPTIGEICINKYDPRNTSKQIENITFTLENNGYMQVNFKDLIVIVDLKPAEERYQMIHGSDLKRNK